MDWPRLSARTHETFASTRCVNEGQVSPQPSQYQPTPPT